MWRIYFALASAAALSACAGTRVATRPSTPAQSWETRVVQLQAMPAWHMQGRAAAAAGNQGWQATLDWRQSGSEAQVRLAGPMGIGAVSLRLTAAGITIERGGGTHQSPGETDPNRLLRDRMGFDAPFADLRYWLLGIPSPRSAFSLERNPADRAGKISQDDWSIDYARYAPAGSDVLPALMTLRHDTVRVRIVIDHWDFGDAR